MRDTQAPVRGQHYLLVLALIAWPVTAGQAAPYTAHEVTPTARPAAASVAAPALLRTAPAAGAILPAPPPAVILLFAAPLDSRRSTFVVASDSMAVVNGSVTLAAGGRELRGPLREHLRPGPYAVVWAAAVRGGPVVRRSYLFTVGPAGPPLLPDHPVSLSQSIDGLSIGLVAPSDRVAHQTYTITLSAANRPVTGAQVAVTGQSLDMDMGEAPANVRPTGAGRYVAVGDVVMAGDWQVTVTVRRARSVVTARFTYQAHY